MRLSMPADTAVHPNSIGIMIFHPEDFFGTGLGSRTLIFLENGKAGWNRYRFPVVFSSVSSTFPAVSSDAIQRLVILQLDLCSCLLHRAPYLSGYTGSFLIRQKEQQRDRVSPVYLCYSVE